jgi:hypothetical protein
MLCFFEVAQIYSKMYIKQMIVLKIEFIVIYKIKTAGKKKY